MVKTLRLNSFTMKGLILAGGMMLAAILSFLLFSQQVSAHGYIDGPASRGYLCKTGQNTDCGAIVYEPQSLEAPKGFPAAGPADGKIASAGGAFPKLDEQSATRWSKVNMNSGSVTFHWTLTAAHSTSSWKYYITKTNWNPNAALSRNQFDLTPFCSVPYSGQPPYSYSNTCTVPPRTGYHVILAVWEVADTGNAFYNVIDANFGGNPGDTQAPTAPANLASPSKTATSVSLSWSASTDNVGVTGYRIYRGSTLAGSVSGSTLSYTATGLTANTAYTFTIKAVDAAGNESAASNAVTVTTNTNTGPDTQAPTAPSGLHVMGSATSTTVPLMWSASTDNVGVTGYQVFRGSTLVTTVSGSTLAYTVTGLSANTAYSFTVKAIDAAGNVSAASNAVSVTTPSAPTTYPAWSSTTVYWGGDKVTHNGVNYEAKWWTLGQTPSATSDVWKIIP